MTVTKPQCSRMRDPPYSEALADELQDEQEIRDPKIREHIRKSHQEFLAERASRTKKRSL
jgi:hypothetical protein